MNNANLITANFNGFRTTATVSQLERLETEYLPTSLYSPEFALFGYSIEYKLIPDTRKYRAKTMHGQQDTFLHSGGKTDTLTLGTVSAIIQAGILKSTDILWADSLGYIHDFTDHGFIFSREIKVAFNPEFHFEISE